MKSVSPEKSLQERLLRNVLIPNLIAFLGSFSSLMVVERVRGDIEHGRHESNQEEINFSSIPETFMAIIGAETIAVIDFNSNGAISSTILRLVIAINLFGFLCCMTSMLHRHRKPRAARIFGTIGVAAACSGLLLPASVYFSSYYGWIILGLGSLAILVICVWAFRP